MKQINLPSLGLGLVLGLGLASTLPLLNNARAEEKKETFTQEEVDAKLDELLQSQKEVKTRIDALKDQVRTVKAASGGK